MNISEWWPLVDAETRGWLIEHNGEPLAPHVLADIMTATGEFDFDRRKKARTYSKGNQQKAALIAAFSRPARLYLLDEPSSGLDPVMDAVFRRHVRRVTADGATALLSSHILAEVEQLCDKVTIIRSGVAVESGTLAELRHLTLTRFRVTLAATPEALSTWRGIHVAGHPRPPR